MRGLQKSKRVSWASDLSLCQIKLFLSDESPSQVGLVGQDHLQAKDSWSWHSGGSSSDDNLPPGFEGIQPANFLQNKLSQIPLIQWKCPTRFILDSTWQVAAGEESKELEVETQREMRVLEAVYPRPSAVPPNPASTMGNDESYYNDQHTPIIPITPIEDEDTAPETSSSSSTNIMLPPAVVPGVEPDVVAALSAAMSGTAPGSLIDQSLLIKLLSDPGLIEKLVSTHAPSASSQQISQLGQQISQPPPVPATFSPPISLPDPPLPVHTRPTHHPFSTPSSSGTHYPPPSRVGPVPVPVHVSVPAPVSAPNLQPPQPPLAEVNPLGKKDLNYYKSLIQQHGGDKPGVNNNNNNNQKTRDVKQKSMKACIYFNSAQGCRHGANCVFQHERANNSLQETQSAKRMKMDREITGT
ncbi:zinc finger CCCH domain-containing protein 6-like [Bidens hawaiensis]|uniref:zinc finger CCCH domain-containing protein 6-like n=1 Tax=Bidens hawaiensis TaxID=980011 RepID=UPI00404A5424